ncbi:1-deoxy-D-xylulose-5-phosphate reductoisomerase [Chitinivorax sp. B]|uniref:1-deoxy-D-xylulose-5-phosphate reductoisomerase n=1 Tax=Chitinivorax sp. B TaxID=2502235 RepID=UPI0010F7D607|nr:1-deoxy-D-xylulose-5-phosphate reductoisomerase [Chitinivorax sp. B]
MSVIQRLTVLGSTGTIGVNTLDVVARHPDRFEVTALTANSNVDRMVDQCLVFRPRYAAMLDESAALVLRERLAALDSSTEVLAGAAAQETLASLPEVDVVMAAIVGAAGLGPTMAAARAGKRILLANKETLVMAGRLFMDAVNAHRATLLPIDSEHNAIFQAMPSGYNGNLGTAGVDRILLTASGGPFRCTPASELVTVTPEQACAHPNWVMGRKISVDSATMMNKGLEVIEAHWLFNAPPERIEVVIHPQSVIHSLVSYVDGSVLAQLGNPDMRTPIAYALAYPERIGAGVAPLDLAAIATLQFERPDLTRFPCLKLAFDALHQGGTAAAILNAANEVAVAAFLDHALRFDCIAPVVEQVMQRVDCPDVSSIDDLLQIDTVARTLAKETVRQFA